MTEYILKKSCECGGKVYIKTHYDKELKISLIDYAVCASCLCSVVSQTVTEKELLASGIAEREEQ